MKTAEFIYDLNKIDSNGRKCGYYVSHEIYENSNGSKIFRYITRNLRDEKSFGAVNVRGFETEQERNEAVQKMWVKFMDKQKKENGAYPKLIEENHFN
jgi:hypothetical protein